MVKHTQCINLIYIIGLSETYLTSSIDDGSLKIEGYIMSRVDYPFNSKMKGVFYLFIEHTSIKSSWYKHLRECINFKLSIVRKLCAKSIPRQVRGLKAKVSYLIAAPGDITLTQENTSQRILVYNMQ